MNEFIKINGDLMPSPVSFTVRKTDIFSGDSTRSETGVMHRNRIRTGVYQIDLSWKVTKKDLKKLADTIADNELSVTFLDPTSSEQKTIQMYAGDKSAVFLANDKNTTWWTLSCSFNEF